MEAGPGWVGGAGAGQRPNPVTYVDGVLLITLVGVRCFIFIVYYFYNYFYVVIVDV